MKKTHANAPNVAERPEGTNFIRAIINEDLERGTNDNRVATRFPPEPNGYLHIGHAASICLNFGIGEDYDGGVCHLRFDDTNPATEEVEYVNSIQDDIRWLGFDWGAHLYFASDYFEELYEMAIGLIKQGKAYVDSLNEEEIRSYRGTVLEAGRNSPHRDRSVEENLDLFARMRAGEFPDGAHVLRAKIDMASPNMLLRDPVLYRIKHAHHYRTGDSWAIYPLYDYAHPLSDAIEGITHSICTMEFEVHRPLYDWLVENVDREWAPRPRQYEFARRNLEYTIVSKRKLLKLVNDNHVTGWDDPRMPTIAGLRRRGYTPEAIRDYCDRIGVAKADNRVDMALLEFSIRDDLNHRAPRVMGVLRPLRVVITNYPEGQTEELEASYWPHDVPNEGARMVPFSRELFIEENDFSEDPPKGFFRLSPGNEVRLRYGYIIRCDEVVKDEAGKVIELRCSYDPETRSGGAHADRKVKGTIHWVSAAHAVPAEVRLYDRLFQDPNPENVEEGKTFLDNLNPDSCEILGTALLERSMGEAEAGGRFQFERQGYFILDAERNAEGLPVFNRIVTLRDTWGKRGKKATAQKSAKPKTKATPSAPAPVRTRESIAAELDNAGQAALARYLDEVGLGLEEAEVLAGDADMAAFFEAGLAAGGSAKGLASWVVSVLAGALKDADKTWDALSFEGAALAELVGLIDDGTISTRIAKDVLEHMLEHGGTPGEIVEEKGLKQVSDEGAVAAFVDQVVNQFPDKVAAYKDGKKGLIGFFVGQVMRVSAGKANPQMVQQLLQQRLDG